MKKRSFYFLGLSILFISMIYSFWSCKHSSDSTTSYIVIPIKDSVYSYKSCKTNEAEAICKFKCEEGTDISKLRNQNIEYKCTKLEAALPDSYMGNLVSQDMMNNIVSPIREFDTLNILPVDYENFIEFDKLFLEHGKKYEEETAACKSRHCKERHGIILNIWKKYKKDSVTVYQNYTYEHIGTLQWVMLFKKNQNGILTPMLDTYENSKKACETYEFNNHKDWSLPTSSDLVEALNLDLGDELSRNLKGNFASYNVWTLDKKVYGLMRISDEIEPIQIDGKIEDQKEYVICSRTYTLD